MSAEHMAKALRAMAEKRGYVIMSSENWLADCDTRRLTYGGESPQGGVAYDDDSNVHGLMAPAACDMGIWFNEPIGPEESTVFLRGLYKDLSNELLTIPKQFDEISKWDRRFLRLAKMVATWSKDPDTQVGAILVADKRVVATGYNGFPQRVDDLVDRLTRPTKYDYVVHAEANAVIQAGDRAHGALLYCTHKPCNECMKLLIQAGVIGVVHLDQAITMDGKAEVTRMMSQESGVGIVCVEGYHE